MTKKLSVKQKKWLLSAHILFAVAWLGTMFGFLVLSITAVITTDGEELEAISIVMHLLDTTLVPVAALGTVISGVFLSVLTQWGLTLMHVPSPDRWRSRRRRLRFL